MFSPTRYISTALLKYTKYITEETFFLHLKLIGQYIYSKPPIFWLCEKFNGKSWSSKVNKLNKTWVITLLQWRPRKVNLGKEVQDIPSIFLLVLYFFVVFCYSNFYSNCFPPSMIQPLKYFFKYLNIFKLVFKFYWLITKSVITPRMLSM